MTTHTKPMTARTWVDYNIPSNRFHTVMTFNYTYGWMAQIWHEGQIIVSSRHPTEDAAKTQAVALANKKWPCT